MSERQVKTGAETDVHVLARTVVFVVDGADTARFAEAEATLRAALAAGALPPQTTAALLCFTKLDVVLGSAESARAALQGERLRQALSEWQQLQATERRVDVIMASTKVILPPGVSNEGRSSELLALAPAVSWAWVPAWGSLEPPR